MRLRTLVAEAVLVSIVVTNGIGALPRFSSAQQAPLPDMVLRWNTILLNAQVVDHTPGAGVPGAGLKRNGGPTMGARAMAMVHGAIYDAINAIEQTHTPYLLTQHAPAGASPEAAVIQAAHDVLASVYPEQSASFASALASDMALIPNGQAKTDGIAIGQAAAAAMIAARVNDGDDSPSGYVPNNNPGHWRPDPLHPTQTPYADYYGTVRPFVISSPADFAAPAVPALNSEEYANAYNEVKSLGAKNSATRTQEQTNIGIYWGYDGSPGLGVPPRLYNKIAQVIAEQEGNTQSENARLFALISLAMADSGISAWKAKYDYDFWRPVTGIRESDPGTGPTGLGDGNDITIGDPSWEPLGAPASNPQLSATPETPPTNFTPPFPAYTSGHATFGAAAFKSIANFYGRDNIAFTFTSDELNGITRDQSGAIRPRVPRSFTSLSQAAYENAQSRIYLGIHWSFDRDQGISQGTRIANDIYGRFATPLPSTDVAVQGSAPKLVQKNDPFTATVSARNNGQLAATSTVVTVALPADFSFDTQASDARCTLGQNNLVSCAVTAEGGLAPLAETSFNLRLTAGETLCSTTATPIATVDAAEGDGNTSNNSTSMPVFVGCPTPEQVELEATITGSDRIFRGDEIRYQLSVANTGPATASNVRIALPLHGLTLGAGNPAECTQLGDEVVCAGFSLSAGSSRSFSIAVATTLETACPQNIDAASTVTSDASDYYEANNTSGTVRTAIECEPQADVAIRYTGPSGAPRGQNMIFTAVAYNSGPATASNTRITIPLDQGMTFQQAQSTPGCTQEGANVVCTAQSIAVSGNAGFDLVFSTLSSMDCGTQLRTQASVQATERDIEPANNVSVPVATVIGCSSDDGGNIGGQQAGEQEEDDDQSARRSELAQSHSHRGHGTTEAAMVMTFLAHNHNIQIADNNGQDYGTLVGHFAFASDASRVFALKMDPFGLRGRNVAYAPYTEDELSVVCGMRNYLHQEAHMNRMHTMMPWVIEKLSSMLNRDPKDIEAALEGEATCL